MIRAIAAVVLVAGLLAAAPAATAGSETPPAGPPWVRDFQAAQRTALEKGLPIFVYMTKTH